MPRIERSPDDLYFLYTGGTTGMPKGVMWRLGDLWDVLADSTYTLAGKTAPDVRWPMPARSRKELADSGVEPRAPSRVAAHARHRRVHVVPVAVPRQRRS